MNRATRPLRELVRSFGSKGTGQFSEPDITSLPAADAGGSVLESSYYADGRLASQKQHGISNGYLLDPEGRASRTTTVDEALQATTTVSHYAGPGGSPAWSYDETAKVWTRDIAAFSGLVATQQQGSEAVIELSDLQGNVVGTASSSEAAGRPLAMERASTFGEPVSGKPVDKLKWLGTAGVSSELPGGAVAKDGITYVPQLGQALQTTSTTVPSPENTATAYVSSLGSGANALAQAASAQETTIYQEATRKAEEAAGPATGSIPTPEGEVIDPTWSGIEFYQELASRLKGLNSLLNEIGLIMAALEATPKAPIIMGIAVGAYGGYLNMMIAIVQGQVKRLENEAKTKYWHGADWVVVESIEPNVELPIYGDIKRRLPYVISLSQCSYAMTYLVEPKVSTAFRCGKALRRRQGIHT
ncbi:MAG: hypothetical protein ACYCST_19400 [Acidimicrobiales bacterium]